MGQTKTQTPILKYVKVLDDGVVDVNSGFFTTMVIKQDGSLWATGYNNYGQLGDGTKVDKKNFVKVIDAGVRVVEPSGHFCHVLKDDGSVWATGWNRHSQLGDGTKTDRTTFGKVISSGVKRIATGHDQFYAIKQDGSLWGSGYNHWGQLGDGKTAATSTGATTSTEFRKLTNMIVKEVGSGNHHSVLLNDKNQLCGTGYNLYNQLGNGDTKNVVGFDKGCYPRPGPCATNNGGCHSKRTCSLTGGSVKCGDCAGSLTNDGPKGCKGNFKAISRVITVFYLDTAVLGTDGTAYIVGINGNGQLGIGNTIDQSKFRKLPDVTMVDGGLKHSITLKKDGSVWTAGYNQRGQLGDGTNTQRTTFVKVIDSGVIRVDGGIESSKVIKQDGSLWAAGYNNVGQFGDGTKTNSNKFVKVLDDGVVDVSSGVYTTMVIKQDGSLWAAGYNNFGQLGDGTKTNKD